MRDREIIKRVSITVNGEARQEKITIVVPW